MIKYQFHYLSSLYRYRSIKSVVATGREGTVQFDASVVKIDIKMFVLVGICSQSCFYLCTTSSTYSLIGNMRTMSSESSCSKTHACFGKVPNFIDDY